MRCHKRASAAIAAAFAVGALGGAQPAIAQLPAASVPLPPASTQLSTSPTFTSPTQPSGTSTEGVIGGGPPPAQRCIEVEIGGETSDGFGCLNQQLKQQVERVNPLLNQTPFDARSPDVKIGIANQAAIRQQLKPGHSR